MLHVYLTGALPRMKPDELLVENPEGSVALVEGEAEAASQTLSAAVFGIQSHHLRHLRARAFHSEGVFFFLKFFVRDHVGCV